MIVTNGIVDNVSPSRRTGVSSMMTISTDQEKVFKELIDLLAELVAKRLDTKKELDSDFIDQIVSEITDNSDFQREIEEQVDSAVRGLDFSISVI